MKNIIKINLIFLVIFIIFSSKSIAADNILPLPKPTLDKETTEIIAKKKLIYPRKKPDEEKEEILTESTEKEEEVSEDIKEEVFIYPKKKPILVQKKVDKTVAKSEILSKKDFIIAKKTFEHIDKKKMANCIKNFKKGQG